MPSKDTKILEFNRYQKSDYVPLIIYADLECLIEKIDRCKNNPDKLICSKSKWNIPSDFSMSKISSFKNIANKHDLHRGKNCMKKFCEILREHEIKIINFKKKK